MPSWMLSSGTMVRLPSCWVRWNYATSPMNFSQICCIVVLRRDPLLLVVCFYDYILPKGCSLVFFLLQQLYAMPAAASWQKKSRAADRYYFVTYHLKMRKTESKGRIIGSAVSLLPLCPVNIIRFQSIVVQPGNRHFRTVPENIPQGGQKIVAPLSGPDRQHAAGPQPVTE